MVTARCSWPQDIAEELGTFLGWQAWYPDDAHILGSSLQLHQALQFILRRAAAFGLDDLGRVIMAPGTPEDSPLRRVTLVPCRPDTGIKALGIPVCHPCALVNDEPECQKTRLPLAYPFPVPEAFCGGDRYRPAQQRSNVS